MVPCTHPTDNPKRHLDRVSRIAEVTVVISGRTDIQTERRRTELDRSEQAAYVTELCGRLKCKKRDTLRMFVGKHTPSQKSHG